MQNLILGNNMPYLPARLFFEDLFEGHCHPTTSKSALILLREKGESAEEIFALCSLVREKALKLSVKIPFLVDNCGTGGDHKGTFNISTLAALVAAGAGAHVAKHGNRSFSSRVGSADLLEALGVKIAAKAERMIEALRTIGIGYFHAPLYHPALQKVQSLRKSIKGRTIFNLIGPLLNPLNVKRQVIGVPQIENVEPIAKALSLLGTQHSFVITGDGGMDEATPAGATAGIEIVGKKLLPFRLNPSRLGLGRSRNSNLRGGNLRENAKIAMDLLKGEKNGACKNAVLLNAGITLYASGRAADTADGIVKARASLESGSAYETLRKLVHISNR